MILFFYLKFCKVTPLYCMITNFAQQIRELFSFRNYSTSPLRIKFYCISSLPVYM